MSCRRRRRRGGHGRRIVGATGARSALATTRGENARRQVAPTDDADRGDRAIFSGDVYYQGLLPVARPLGLPRHIPRQDELEASFLGHIAKLLGDLDRLADDGDVDRLAD